MPENRSNQDQEHLLAPEQEAPVDSCSLRLMRVGPVDVALPSYKTTLAAGLDLSAALETPLHVAPLARVLVPTGIAVALPPGYEGQVRPRSGLAWTSGLTVLNAPGTIDADYRGEIKVILINLSSELVVIAPHDRIAQLVIARYSQADIRLVTTLDETARSTGGFGSTGKQ